MQNQTSEIMSMNKQSELLADTKANNMTSYSDDYVAFFDSTERIVSVRKTHIDALLVGLCQQGNATFTINGRNYSIMAGDLVVLLPGMTIEIFSTSDDISGRCFSLAKDYIYKLAQINVGDAWNAMVALRDSPVFHLQRDEAQAFCIYYDLILSRLNLKQYRYKSKLIEMLMTAFVYDFHRLLDRSFTQPETPRRSAEKVFREFITLLSDTYPRPRVVAYYADKLCLTSKYLSAVCKQVSGQTAAKLITQFVVNDIRRLLDETEKSMKEISNELDFPNPSFFGTYVRKNLGISPRQFRERGK